MITCTRRIQFCAGHRLVGHESKCINIHGHNYVALIHAISNDLDSVGRVIDFSVLKQKIGGWIDEQWDHTFIANVEDKEVIEFVKKINKKPIFILNANPTAENMASYLLEVICPSLLMNSGVSVFKIELWETENCKATALGDTCTE